MIKLLCKLCNRYRIGILPVFLLVTLPACHKDNWEMQNRHQEHQLAKRLTKGEGIWSVDNITIVKISTSGATETMVDASNCGEMQFIFEGRSNGSVTMDYTVNGLTIQGVYSWFLFGGSANRIDFYDGNMDTYMDIELNTRKEQIWNAFFIDSMYSYKETFSLKFLQ